MFVACWVGGDLGFGPVGWGGGVKPLGVSYARGG